MSIIRTELLEFPNEDQFKIIHKDLNISESTLKQNEVLFLEWLNNHPTLPKRYEIHLIRNFIRLCKNNLEKAKSKYESYVTVRETIPELFQDRCVDEDSFVDSLSHRSVTVIRNLTPECYRVMFIKIPKIEVTDKEVNECLKYMTLCADFVFSNSSEAGHIFVFDSSGFNLRHLKLLSLKLIKTMVYVIFKVYPSRLKEIHLLNTNVFASTVIEVIKLLLPEKLKKRIKVHKNVSDLVKFLDPSCVPSDYGGTAENSNEICDNWKSFFVGQREWILENCNLKPITKTD